MKLLPHDVDDENTDVANLVSSADDEAIVHLLTDALTPLAVEVCRKIITTYGSLRRMAGASPAELHQFGLTPETVRRFEAVFEIAKRYGEEEWLTGKAFGGAYDIYAHYRERLASETVEHFYAVLLDNKHRKLREVLVSKGSLTSAVVHPRDVYLPVIRESAAAIVLVHNHPSGYPVPSKDDIEITRRLRDVGELIGVRVLDHVIVGRGSYVSFVDDGYW
jgi:DNA repair protein RadC